MSHWEGDARVHGSKMKPAKAAGKRKTSAQAVNAVSDSAPKSQPTFDDAIHSAQEKLVIKLENHALDCEISTREAIRAVQPTEKLSAFHSGFDEWRDTRAAPTWGSTGSL